VDTHILKMTGHDEQREIDFELAFLATLSVAERVRLALERSRLLVEMLERDGHPIVPGITRRP